MTKARCIRICILVSIMLSPVLPVLAADQVSLVSLIPEVVSPLGQALYARPAEGEALVKLEKELADARETFKAKPDDPESYVMLGRRLAYLWRYHEAIAVFSQGISRFPNHAMLYRHRGHRHISTRRYSLAQADLNKAAELKKDDFDIWYHLGLSFYLQGKFAEARDAYRECRKFAKDDDSIIAVSNWLTLTCLRLGRQEEANEVLKKITKGMKVVENQGYYHLLHLYKGWETEEQLLAYAGQSPLELGTCRYGYASWLITQQQGAKARELLGKIVADSRYWPAFGFIAAEAELQRLPVSLEKISEPVTPEGLKVSVSKALQAWVGMWNTNDLEKVRLLFADDSRLTYFSSEKQGVIRGLEAVTKHHEGFGFVSGGKEMPTMLWLEDVGIDTFGDTAIVTGVWFFAKNKGTLEEKLQKGPFTFVYRTVNGFPLLIHGNFGNYKV